MADIKKGSKCFYVGAREEDPLAVIKFLYTGPNLIVINRTYVSEALRGQNIARQLLQKTVDLARKENKKIISHCSYVSAVFRKTGAYDDVLYKDGSPYKS